MLMVHQETSTQCCMPGKYKDPQKFENALDELEGNLDEQTVKPFEASGHAFVTFNSIKATEACLEHFQIGLQDQARLFVNEIRDRVRSCFQVAENNRRRA